MSDINMSELLGGQVSVYDDCMLKADGYKVASVSRGHAKHIARAINSHDKLTARIAELEVLIKEAYEYLNTNSMTSIGSGSVLHTKFKQALADNS